MVQIGLAERLAHSTAESLLFAVVAIAATAAVAEVCFRCIEQPGISWGRQLIAYWSARGPERMAP
jgi:peptidoglycan/LPS O-acetylase OafA/YrhL